MRTVFLFRVIIIIDTIYKKEYNHPYLNTVLKSEKKVINLIKLYFKWRENEEYK